MYAYQYMINVKEGLNSIRRYVHVDVNHKMDARVHVQAVITMIC